MGAIQDYQKRTIYAISRSLGLDNELLHTLVEGVTGCCSIKALTEEQARQVVDELKARQKTAGIQPPAPARKKALEKPGGITRQQQGKVWALLGELEKYDTKPSKAGYKQRLCGIIKKELGMDAAPSAPFQWLTMKQGIKLIDALDRYVTQAERKAIREGRVPHG